MCLYLRCDSRRQGRVIIERAFAPLGQTWSARVLQSVARRAALLASINSGMHSVGGRDADWLTDPKHDKLSSAARALRGCLNALGVAEKAR